jgi:hypothetical protein
MKKLILTIVLLASTICSAAYSQECIPVKNFDCTVPDASGAWQCVPLVGTKTFTCRYDVVEPIPEPTPEPTCTPTWCSAALIPCDQTPITGVDSCGNVCTKPSPEWPNCIAN